MAKRGLNKVQLIGNIGKDPEARQSQGGGTIANLTLATSETWKDKTTGEPKEKTEWHRVVFYGKLAEIVAQYVKKGAKLYVEGRLETRKWTDQQGQERYTTEIIADEMQMLDSRQQGQGGNAGGAQGYGQQQGNAGFAPPAQQGFGAGAADDAPF